MFQRIVLFFIPEDLRLDVERFRAARFLVSASLLTALFSASYIALSLFVGFMPGVWAMVFNAAAFPVLPFIFRRTRSVRLVVNLYVLVGTIGVGIVVFYSGGFGSPILPWFGILPMAAVLLDGPKSGWPWTAVAILAVAGFAAASMSGYTFPNAVGEPYRTLFAVGDHLGLVLLIFVIALIFQNERARAFTQVHSKNEELEQALDNLHRTQAQLIHSEKMASLGQLTTGIAHELQNPLNFVNNFSSLSAELVEEVEEELRNPVENRTALHAALEDLRTNLHRIKSHGQRAERIIRSMMAHATERRGERQSVLLNHMLNDFVRLAEHGRQAQDAGLEAQIVRHLDPDAGHVDLLPTEMGRVILNVLDNALLAVRARSAEGGPDYEPTVTISSKRDADRVHIQIRDNGIGIPAAIRDRVFEPFFTTRPAGEGTGLGLSMAYEIVVEGHGGTISVESEEGEGTTMSITLPG